MLTDEQILDAVQPSLPGKGHAYIWKTDPEYAKAVNIDEGARWIINEMRPEHTISACRAIESAATAPLLEEIERLKQRCAELEKDAGRYRWLRDESQWLEGVPQAIIWNNQGHVQEICAEDDLDNAIDSAMSGQEKA